MNKIQTKKYRKEHMTHKSHGERAIVVRICNPGRRIKKTEKKSRQKQYLKR